MISEEKLFQKYTTHPLKMVGFEGVFGSIFIFIALIIMNLIPCTENETYCVNNHFEDSIFALKQMYSVPWILAI